jgi:hypothetical protein
MMPPSATTTVACGSSASGWREVGFRRGGMQPVAAEALGTPVLLGQLSLETSWQGVVGPWAANRGGTEPRRVWRRLRSVGE